LQEHTPKNWLEEAIEFANENMKVLQRYKEKNQNASQAELVSLESNLLKD